VTYTYGYDNAHQLASVTDSRGSKTLAYAWSPGGLLNSLTDSEGRITDYLYDPVGRLAEVIGPNDNSIVFRFDAGGRLQEKLLPTGGSARYAYNEDNSLKQVVNRNTAASILTQHDYAYDGVGNRLSHAENIGGSTLNYAYSYDELQRLTQVANGTASQQENYTYDPLGNRTTKSIGNPAATTFAYKYDAANQLTEIHSGSLAGPLLATLTYDFNGNVASDGIRSYTWDALDQLAQVSAGATTVTYSYDSEGRRIKKITGGQTTQWLSDSQNIYAEYGTAWTNPNAVYTSAGLDRPLIRATVNGSSYGQTQYYHADGLGSIIATSNSADTTTATQRFDAWGTKLASIGAIAQYGYTGREPDETGLIYYRARYTDPTTGRFVSRDRLGVQGGINFYRYVRNNPVNLTDPMGLLPTGPSGSGSGSYTGGCLSYNDGWRGEPETMTDVDVAENEGYDLSDGPVLVAAGAACYASDPSGTSNANTPWSPAANAAADAGIFIGPSLGDAGIARASYETMVSALDPNDSAGREFVKQLIRGQTPPLVGQPLEAMYPDLGPRPGSVGSANVSNAGANVAGSVFRVAGPTLLLGGVAYDAYQVATSSTPYRDLAAASFGVLGSIGGGTLFAIGGSFVTPVAGTIVGGVTGAVAGGYAGRQLGGAVYDFLFNPTHP
jgi:RHS repeat-associated protein